jgi:steroid delta-isomerase-like uncharacterized protein
VSTPPPVDELLDGWQAAWSGRDRSAFAAVCAPDVHYEDPVCDQPLQGADQIARHAALLWKTFPDARVERTGSRLTDGRYVAAPCKLLGSHRGSLDELPASGRFVIVHGVLVAEVEDSRLTRVRVFFDRYDAAQQLGILPSPGTMGEKALLLLRGFGLRLRGELP